MSGALYMLMEVLVFNPGTGARKHIARAVSAITLALVSIAIVFAVGDLSWKIVLIVAGIAALFWLLLTILDISVNLLTRSGKAH